MKILKALIPSVVILLGTAALVYFSWPREERKPNLANIQPLEYYSVEEHGADTSFIPFYFENVIGYICYSDNVENRYIIEYDDPDAFDYDYYSEMSGDTITPLDFIVIDATQSDFYELLKDNDLPIAERAYLENDWKWMIMEVATCNEDSTIFYQYYLVKHTL